MERIQGLHWACITPRGGREICSRCEEQLAANSTGRSDEVAWAALQMALLKLCRTPLMYTAHAYGVANAGPGTGIYGVRGSFDVRKGLRPLHILWYGAEVAVRMDVPLGIGSVSAGAV